LFAFSGASLPSYITSTKKSITDAYVPIGAMTVTVASGHSFQVGDHVYLHHIPNQAWIDLLTMAQWGWTYSSYDVDFDRVVKGVNGNSITLDAPVMDIIDPIYSTGELVKYTSTRIENCGIENMRISSYYASATDENHGWEAVSFNNLINSWAKNLEVYYFGYSAVHVLDGATWVTVDSCKMLDAKSTIDGGRRYSVNVDGQRVQVTVPKRIKPWWFVSEAGKVCVAIRYGAKIVELSKGKTAIEVASPTALIDTLETVHGAVLAGELDQQIEAVSGQIRSLFNK
jgi:hypothetical protein